MQSGGSCAAARCNRQWPSIAWWCNIIALVVMTEWNCCLASDTCRVRWLPWSRGLLCSSSSVLGLRLSLEQCLSVELSSVRPSTCMHASRCVCKSSRIVVHSAVNVSSRCCLFVVHPRGRLRPASVCGTREERAQRNWCGERHHKNV